MKSTSLKSRIKPSDITFKAYDIREDIHQLIAWGYQDAVHMIHCELPEEEITHLMREAIDNRMCDPRTPSRFDVYSVHEDDPHKPDSRFFYIDLVFRITRSRTQYAFEAKRLKKGSHPISVYCGTEGLKCFIDDGGKYVPNSDEAGMLGFFQTGDVSYWEKQLKKKFEEGNNGLNLKDSLKKVSVIASLQHEWKSVHNRKANSAITIYHIFLDCSFEKGSSRMS